jgi:sugar phosphate isomerase/epimerase
MAVLSVNETTTFRWSFEDDVAHYAAAGIPAIGVWRQKLSDYGQDRAVELLQQHGLKVSHLFWAGGYTGSEGHSYRESVADTADALRTASALGANCLVVCSGTRAGHTHNHARRLVQNALKELLPLAHELGVVMALEPMHAGCAAQCTFLNTLDDALKIIHTVDSPSLKLVLDTYHLGQAAGLVERIPEIVSQIALVQLGDAKSPPQGEQNRCRLGEGTIPLRQIVCALKSSGYDGYFDVELLGEDMETTDYHSLLAHAREAFTELVAHRHDRQGD